MPGTPTAPTRSSRRRARPTARTSGRGPIAATRATAASVAPAGAREPVTRRGGRAEAAPRALVIAAVVALVACTDGGSDVPSRLVDGTATRDAPVELDNVSDAV